MPENESRDIQSRKIIGMPVYSCTEGLYLGNIKNLLVDIKDCKVQGFIVERRRLSKDERILPFAAVHSFGEDSITVQTAGQMERRGQSSQYIRALRHPVEIIGSRVFTTAGRTLGKIEEYRFESASGNISGMEISPDGFFKVRSLVRGKYIIAIAGNTVMLRDEAATDAENIENVFIANMGNAAETVKEKAEEIISNTADMTRRLSSNISERVERFKKREEDYLEEEFADDLEQESELIIDVEPAIEPEAEPLIEEPMPAAEIPVQEEEVTEAEAIQEAVISEAAPDEAASDEDDATSEFETKMVYDPKKGFAVSTRVIRSAKVKEEEEKEKNADTRSADVADALEDGQRQAN